MAWNGSGTYSRPATSVSPASSNTTISSTDMNTYTADVTAGVNACLAKNGENAATANLDIGGFQLKDVADGTALTDAATVGQVQNAAYAYAVDTGTANTYAVALTPAITAYAAGQVITFKAINSNTGTSTLNVNSLGVKSIAKHDPETNNVVALEANDIVDNCVYTVVYDGTLFHLLGAAPRDTGFEATAASGSVTASFSQMAFGTEVRDPGSNFASSYYTCPTDGVYQFNAQYSINALATTHNMQIAFYVDTGGGDTAWHYGDLKWNRSGSDMLMVCRASASGFLDAGDKVSVYAKHTDSGTGSESVVTNALYNYFNGHRVNLG